MNSRKEPLEKRSQKGPGKKRIWLLGAMGIFLSAWITPSEKNISRAQRFIAPPASKVPATLKDSIDKRTGLIVAPGHQLIVKNCLKCHSPQLISAKRATREGWLATIRWMQHNQGLWDLGPEEPLILDYLTQNYAPTYEGRRPMLRKIEWYKLEK